MKATFEQQEKRILAEIHSYIRQLEESGKDLRYHIGDTFIECLHPVWKIFAFPKRLLAIRKERRSKKWDIPVRKEGQEEQAYLEELSAYRDELQGYALLRRSDVRFRIGYEILKALDFPPRILALPFILLWVAILEMSRKSRRGMLSFRRWRRNKVRQMCVSMGIRVGVISRHMSPVVGINRCVLFIATNGAGLGHLTRCLAIARKMQVQDPGLEIIFLTTSLALTTVHREGFTAYCVPSKMLIKNMTSSQWNVLLRNQLEELMDLYPFQAIIFDGAMPYASISAAMADDNGVCKIWVKRGSERSDIELDKRADAENQFDYVIVPGEAGAKLTSDQENRIAVNPIIYLDREELWSREDVRTYLKIPEGKKAVYVQLGAGNINDIDSDISKILRELRKHDDLVMILGESMIGNELKIVEKDIIIIKDYPNSKYFNGFDFAVSACGYNSFHELLFFGVPTLFLPNRKTKTDDQYARAMISQNAGAGIVVTDINSDQLSKAVDRLCDDAENRKMRENAKGIIPENGADRAAELILELSGLTVQLVGNEGLADDEGDE